MCKLNSYGQTKVALLVKELVDLHANVNKKTWNSKLDIENVRIFNEMQQTLEWKQGQMRYKLTKLQSMYCTFGLENSHALKHNLQGLTLEIQHSRLKEVQDCFYLLERHFHILIQEYLHVQSTVQLQYSEKMTKSWLQVRTKVSQGKTFHAPKLIFIICYRIYG